MADPALIFLRTAQGLPNILAWSFRVLFAAVSLPAVTGAFAGDGVQPETIHTALIGRSISQSLVDTSILDSFGSQVQMVANDKAPFAYFLDQPHLDIDVSKLPSAARDVAIVRVRALQTPSSRGGRDQSGAPPTDIPRDRLFIRIRVLEVRSGAAAVGKEYDIYFGERGRDLLYPITPDQLTRDYTVAMYFDPLDSKHRLIGFPVSSKQYWDWRAQVSEYQRSRYKK